MSSVIDLCDSSDDEVDLKLDKSSPSPDDASSSSSDDDILYAPSIFCGVQRKQPISTRNASTKDEHHCSSKVGVKRKAPLKSKGVDSKKPKPASDDIIELGSSSDEEPPKKAILYSKFDNKVVKTSENHLGGSGNDTNGDSDESSEGSSVHVSSADRTKPLGRQMSSQERATVHNSLKNKSQSSSSSYHACSKMNDSNDCTSKKADCSNEPFLNKTHESSGNEPFLNKTHESSDASSATKSLLYNDDEPARLKSPPEKLVGNAHPPKEIDLSMDSSNEENSSPNHDCAQNSSKKKQMTNKKSVDWSFDLDEGFDEDDQSDLDTKPKALHTGSKFRFSRDREGNNQLELGSNSDSSASSDMPLFTPRPLKKTKIPDAANAAAVAAASLAISSSKSKESIHEDSSSPELMTPRAFSPPSTSPLTTYAAKKKVPVPAIPALPSEVINEIGGKLYPDLKHSFLIALAHHARKARHAAFERGTFDSCLRSIIAICMHLRPLRSPEAARRIKGVGGNLYDLLKDSISGPAAKAPFVPRQNKYSCVAAAALVALLELEEDNESKEGQCFPMEDLIAKTNELLDPRAKANLNETVDKYLDANTLDPNWGQVKKLCSTNSNADMCGPFFKERKKKHTCSSGVVFELLNTGRDIAIKLRELARAPPVEPGPLRQLPYDNVDEEFGNVTMSMDFREGGGAGKGLHKMCDHLDTRGVPYVVRELKIADYLFFVGDKLAPILIERKTAEDLAGSLHDKRWERQQRSMRKAQFVLGGGEARRCQICYIVEGDANKKKVHGGNVGRRSWFQSVEDVENAIESLPSLGFSVMRSKGKLDTIGILAKVAADVSWKAKNGVIDLEFTYQQFLRRVNSLSDDKGDAPTSREHQNPAPPVVIANPNPPPDTRYNSTEGVSSTNVHQNAGQNSEENSEAIVELNKLSIQALKERCKDRGEKIGGKKADLVARLLKPRKPEILLMRMRRGEYVPKVPSSNAALLVALLLHHVPGTQGMTKERLMVFAEETGVSKESMSGDGGFYDGWSGMKQLREGDPALVRQEKGHRYSLTTQPPESSGVAVASALHILAHREGLCTCGSNPEG